MKIIIALSALIIGFFSGYYFRVEEEIRLLNTAKPSIESVKEKFDRMEKDLDLQLENVGKRQAR